MKRSLCLILLLVACAGWGAARAEGVEKPSGENKGAVVTLRVIDKLAAKPHELKVNAGTVANYETLSIMPQRCSVNNEGEYAALLEIYDQPPAGGTQSLFSGWMFSASPSLSHIEHPFYDVVLVGCEAHAAESKTNKTPQATQQ